MVKEKFEREGSQININEVTEKNAELNANRTTFMYERAVAYTENNRVMNELRTLRDLIEEYGEEEGKRRYEILKQEMAERTRDFQRVDAVQEVREAGVNVSKRR